MSEANVAAAMVFSRFQEPDNYERSLPRTFPQALAFERELLLLF